MAVELTLRKWGSSFGAVFPKEIVEKEKLMENQKIEVEIVRKANLRKVFGSLSKKMSGQAFKDMIKKEW